MLLICCIIIFLVCLIPLLIFISKKKFISKHKRLFSILTVFIILLTIFFITIKFLLPILPHNDVSKEDRILLKTYILDKYGLELTVTESEIIHRGNIGINPGIAYKFVLKNSAGFEYCININKLYEVDLKSILSETPELELIQMK